MSYLFYGIQQIYRFESIGMQIQGYIKFEELLGDILFKHCNKLERISNLQGLTRLKSLQITDCANLRDWECLVGHVEGSLCRLDYFTGSSNYKRISSYDGLPNVTSIGALANHLEGLDCKSLQVPR